MSETGWQKIGLNQAETTEIIDERAMAYGKLRCIDGKEILVPDPSYREVISGELHQLLPMSVQEQEQILRCLDQAIGPDYCRHRLTLYQPRLIAQVYVWNETRQEPISAL